MTPLPSFRESFKRVYKKYFEKLAKKYFERIWNTYVPVRLPWIRNTHTAAFWEARRLDDSLGPRHYVDLQESSHVLIDEVIRCASGPGAPILDLGCNVGRHLNALCKRGFTNLYGLDVQRAALEYMREVFPGMAAVAHIEQGTFEERLPRIPDRFFEVVFTYGATVELVPPSFPICLHMARTARRAVVMVIDENNGVYPRLWETEFARANFALAKALRPVVPGETRPLLVFQPMSK